MAFKLFIPPKRIHATGKQRKRAKPDTTELALIDGEIKP